MPRNARSDVVFAAACSCVVSKSRCWRLRTAYAPVTLPLAPSPSRIVFWKTLPLAAPKPSDDPVELRVAGDAGALRAEDPRLLVEALGRDEAQVGVLPDDELDDGVEQAVGRRELLLPDLGLRALLEDDEHAPAHGGALLGLDRGEQDGGVEPRVARDVDERAALPLRRVAGDEGVVGRGHDRAEVRLDEVAVRLDRLRQRHDERAVGRDVRPCVQASSTWRSSSAGRREHRLGLGGEVAAGRRRERREVELAQLGELPARLPLEVGQREVPPGGRCGTSQWSPPSGAR